MPLSNRFGLAHGKKNILRDVSGSNVTGLTLVDSELQLTQSDNQPTRSVDLSSLGGGSIGGTATTGRVAFGSATNQIGSSPFFLFNTTDKTVELSTNESNKVPLKLKHTESSQSGGSGLSITNHSDTAKLDIVHSNSGDTNNIWGYTNIPLQIATNNTARMVITGGGNVGIGTSAPNSELDVKGDIRITNKNGSNPTDAGSLIFEEAGDNWGSSLFGFRINLEGDSNYLNFQSANQSTIKDVLTLTRDTAYVGIGDTAPISKLSVAGKMSLTSESSTPSQPADGKGYIYSKSDGKLYWRSYDISEVDLTADTVVSPGGSTSQVQYNDGGSFAGSSLFTFTTSLGPQLKLTSATDARPTFTMENTNANANASQLIFNKDSSSPADGDEIGQITFTGKDSGDNDTTYADILVQSATVANTSEEGVIRFKTMTDSGLTNALVVSGSSVGIGTTSPLSTRALHVSGRAYFDSDVISESYMQIDKDGSPGLLIGEGGDADIYYDGTDMNINPARIGSGILKIATDTTIAGNLTVQGTTTTIDSTTLSVKDKNIEMGVVSTPTDVTADGGGITLKGTTDKTINWIDSTDSWTSSENFELASGKSFRINANNVLNQTTLGSTVVGSSLTSVGTLTSATISGDLAVDTDTLKVDTSNDRVGINVASPTDTLNISTGAGTFDFRDYNITYSTSLGIRAEGTGYLGLVTEGANDVFISTNGFSNKRLVVKSDGLVGIGTTSPSKKLEVVGHISASSSTATDAIYYSNGNAMMYNNNTHHFFYGGDTSTRWIANDGSSTFMSLMNSGKLGIGDTNPTRHLTVDSASIDIVALFKSTDNRASIQLSDDDTNRHIVTENSAISLGPNSSLHSNNLNIVGSPADVGIGTTGPNAKLEVLSTSNPQIRASYNGSNYLDIYASTGIGYIKQDGRFRASSSTARYFFYGNSNATGRAEMFLSAGGDSANKRLSSFLYLLRGYEGKDGAGIYFGKTVSGSNNEGSAIASGREGTEWYAGLNYTGGGLSDEWILGTDYRTTSGSGADGYTPVITAQKSGAYGPQGKIGINTLNPAATFDIRQRPSNHGLIVDTDYSNGDQIRVLKDGNTSLLGKVVFDGTNMVVGAWGTGGGIRFWNNGEGMRLSGDNLSIGNTSAIASGKLTVKDTSNPQLTVAYDGSNYVTHQYTSAGNYKIITAGGNRYVDLESNYLNIGTGQDVDIRLQFNANSNVGYQLWDEDNARFDFYKGSDSPTLSIDTANARVGIGATAPNVKLDVVGNARVRGTNKLYFGDTATTEYIYADSSDLRLRSSDKIRIDADDDVVITADDINIEDSSENEWARFDGGIPMLEIDGKVRVKDSNKLGVGDSDDFYLYHDGNSTLRNDTGIFNITQNATSNLVMTTNGNSNQLVLKQSNGGVGVGTDAPSEKLHVVGNITGSSNLNLGTKVELQGAGTSTFSAGNTVFGASDVSQNTYLKIMGSGAGYTSAGIKLLTYNGNDRPGGVYSYAHGGTQAWYSGPVYGNSYKWGVNYKSSIANTGSGLELVADDAYNLFTIDKTGQVGIGTTAPQQPLHVLTSANDKGILIDVSDDTHEGRLLFGDTSSNAIGHIGYNHALETMRFTVGGYETVRMANDGSYSKLFLGADSTLGLYRYSNRMDFYISSNPRMHLDASKLYSATSGGPLLDLTPTGGEANYGFYGDQNTGMSRSAADTLHLLTAGVSGMTMNSTQGVGIGVIAPDTLRQGQGLTISGTGITSTAYTSSTHTKVTSLYVPSLGSGSYVLAGIGGKHSQMGGGRAEPPYMVIGAAEQTSLHQNAMGGGRAVSLVLAGTAGYNSGGQDYGNFGSLLFHGNSNWSSNARRWLVSNAWRNSGAGDMGLGFASETSAALDPTVSGSTPSVVFSTDSNYGTAGKGGLLVGNTSHIATGKVTVVDADNGVPLTLAWDGSNYTTFSMDSSNNTVIQAHQGTLGLKTDTGGKRIRLDSKGDVQADLGGSSGTYLFKVVDSSQNWLFTVHDDGLVGLHGSDPAIEIKERSSAPNHTAAFGKLWVKNDDPANLYYTDDAGNDIALTNNGSAAGGGGGGDVTKVGTPANNQVGVWTGDGTIEGDANFTWDASQLALTGTDGNTRSLYLDPAWAVSGDNQYSMISGSSGLALYPGDSNTDLWVHSASRGVRFRAVASDGSFDGNQFLKIWPTNIAADGVADANIRAESGDLSIYTTGDNNLILNSHHSLNSFFDSEYTIYSAADGNPRFMMRDATVASMEFDNSQNIKFKNATSTKMTLDTANGRLGIGTASPGEMLDVRGKVLIDQYLRLQRNTNTNGLNLTDSAGNAVPAHTKGLFAGDGFALSPDASEVILYKSTTGSSTATAGKIKFASRNDAGTSMPFAEIEGIAYDDTASGEDGHIVFRVEKASTMTEQMRLTETGLGIGTSAPNVELHVNGDARIEAGHKLYFDDTGTGEYIFATGNDLRLHASDHLVLDAEDQVTVRASDFAWETDAASEKMRFKADTGRLGINTNAPGATLHVSGNNSYDNTGGIRLGNTSTYASIYMNNSSGGLEIDSPHSMILDANRHMEFHAGGTTREHRFMYATTQYGFMTTAESNSYWAIGNKSIASNGLLLSGAAGGIRMVPANSTVTVKGNVDMENNGAVLFDNTNNNNQTFIRNGGTNAASLQFGVGTPSNSNTKISLADDGKVGIGTTSPNSKMTVQGDLDIPRGSRFRAGSTDSNQGIDIYHNNDGSSTFNGNSVLEGRSSGGDVVFRNLDHGQGYQFHAENSSGTEQLILKLDGANRRVGINKSSPAEALDVNGDIVGTNISSNALMVAGTGLDVAGGTLNTPSLTMGVAVSEIKDEDDMASNSATMLATQQSIKAYVDTQVAGAGGGAVSSYTNSGDNRILTSVDSSTINGEANLTFDGTDASILGTGKLNFNTDGRSFIQSLLPGWIVIKAEGAADGSYAGDLFLTADDIRVETNKLFVGTNDHIDSSMTWRGGSNDGVLTWMEDEDYFEFSDDILLSTTEKIQFNDTGTYIHSSADGQVNIIADVGTTIGNAASGAGNVGLAVASNLVQTLNVDTGNFAVGSDHLMFFDGSATGVPKSMSNLDYISDIAGAGLLANNGQLEAVGGPSDSRLKSNVSNFTYGLDEIKQLTPKYYNYDKDKFDIAELKYPRDDSYFDTQRVGLMADDVKSVMPEITSKIDSTKDYETYDKDALISVLINSVKELEARIAELESKL